MEMRSNCRVCEANLYEIWELKKMPYGDLFKSDKEAARSIALKDMTLSRCSKCKVLQLKSTTNIEAQYDDYLYFTTNTNLLNKFYSEISNKLIYEYELTQNNCILDIGSNDGAFLSHFKEQNFEVLGIEPSKLAADFANSCEITTLRGYFNSKIITSHSLDKKNYDVISINYTLANIENIGIFFENIKRLMGEKTIISIITGYHPDQFAVRMFDYIGHDHLVYFTITDFEKISRDFGMKIIDVTRYEHKGGSIHIVLAKQSSNHSPKSSVTQNLQRELWVNANGDKLIFELAGNISSSKALLHELLRTFTNKKIFGLGASISTSTLITEFEIEQYITGLFDDDIKKIGKFSPYHCIEVFDLKIIKEFSPDLVVILAWQHVNKLIERLNEIKFSGLVVVPLPTLKTYYLGE